MAYSYTYDRSTNDPYRALRHYMGLSSDEKPLENVPNGSDWYSMDTGDVFLFDADGKRWILQ